MTVSCQGRGQKHLRQRDEEIMLFRYTEGRFFCLFKPSHAYQQKIDKGQKSGHRL